MACTGGAYQLEMSPDVLPPAAMPPEADRLGIEVDPVIPSASVSEAEAILAANAENGFDREADSVESWLRRVTDPASRQVLDDRAVWIVHYTGLSIETPSVPRADGGVTPGRILTQAWVFIDADTGAFVMNAFTE